MVQGIAFWAGQQMGIGRTTVNHAQLSWRSKSRISQYRKQPTLGRIGFGRGYNLEGGRYHRRPSSSGSSSLLKSAG